MLNLAATAILQKTLSASKCLFLRPVLQPAAPLVVPERFSGTFFGHKTAKDLWKSVTTVSSQGRKRGRARGVLKIKNLHVGQKLGFGPARMLFPGKADLIFYSGSFADLFFWPDFKVFNVQMLAHKAGHEEENLVWKVVQNVTVYICSLSHVWRKLFFLMGHLHPFPFHLSISMKPSLSRKVLHPIRAQKPCFI